VSGGLLLARSYIERQSYPKLSAKSGEIQAEVDWVKSACNTFNCLCQLVMVCRKSIYFHCCCFEVRVICVTIFCAHLLANW